ncbi:glycoside hydrolase family 73 protein [Acidisoma silvae]|uniref:Glucosaminidase domain-containing protein n=1 Tax=Acidisoma silvae TaxID=2802396 RepID=A0A963YQN4_9PROT|nr:glucosaminidase domain-containing protein [Acidisoma silvae]MCB8874902.1 glucosaminidase domain-containing protein [Acidisoma silvae]
MTIGSLDATAPVPSTQTAQLGQTVERLAGSLWYNLMTEMTRTGGDAGALGPGGETYQTMFLWEIAQKDFGKYDAQIEQAALRQIGGQGTTPVIRNATPIVSATALPQGGIDVETDADQARQARFLTKAIWPAVQAVASLLGVPPVGVLAQAALETGWGAAAPGNNLFGIKAADSQPASDRATHEMINGVLVPLTDRFRDYASADASLADYARLIQSRFPQVVGQASVEGFALALQNGGFASDSAYAAKIIAIAHSPLMQQSLQALADEPDKF